MDKTIELRRLLEAELSKRKQEAGLWNQQGWRRDREPSCQETSQMGGEQGGKS